MKVKYVLILLILVLIPIKVYAVDNVNYKITDLYIDAYIEDNGNMKVSELFILNGSFNGYERDILYKNNTREFKGENTDFIESNIYNASGISNIKIYNVNIIGNIDFNLINKINKEFTKVNSASLGDSYKYIEYSINNGIKFKMYQESLDGYKGFLITYTLNDVVVIHNDVAEMYWTFVGTSFDDFIDNVEIRVHLPNATSDLRVWAHGPLTGDVKKYDNKEMRLTISSLNSYNAIDGRMIFDKNLVPLAKKYSNVNALDRIVEVETNFANYSNQIRDEARLEQERLKQEKQDKYTPFIYGSIFLWFIGLILLIIYTYIKHDKEYKRVFEIDYYREIPSDYPPEVLDYLINRKITNNSLTASLLEIIRKKGLLVEKILGTKKDYKFINPKNKPKEALTDNEIYIKDWFINDIGNGVEVTNKDIEITSKSLSSSQDFMKSYNSWKNKALKKGLKEDFFEDKTSIKILSIIYTLLIFIPIIIGFSIELFIGIIFIPIVLVALVYFITYTKRTTHGNQDYIKWMAFKKFLKDFGRFSDKELPEIYLWEKYLVYATILGVANKVEAAMKIKISELSDKEMMSDFTFLYLYHLGFNHNFTNTIDKAVSNTISSSMSTIASSNNSSGSGFGGGFSSGGGSFGGGGFGGGGGGGRGF